MDGQPEFEVHVIAVHGYNMNVDVTPSKVTIKLSTALAKDILHDIEMEFTHEECRQLIDLLEDLMERIKHESSD